MREKIRFELKSDFLLLSHDIRGEVLSQETIVYYSHHEIDPILRVWRLYSSTQSNSPHDRD